MIASQKIGLLCYNGQYNNPDEKVWTFIVSFLKYLIDYYAADLDECMCSWDVLRAYEIWNKE